MEDQYTVPPPPEDIVRDLRNELSRRDDVDHLETQVSDLSDMIEGLPWQ